MSAASRRFAGPMWRLSAALLLPVWSLVACSGERPVEPTLAPSALPVPPPPPLSCPPGLGDCDGQRGNGCETSLSTSADCGACGEVCGDDAECLAGDCQKGVVEVAAGGSHTCARTGGGDVYCWGLGSLGQLGLSGPRARLRPTHVPALGGAAQLAVGRYFTCVRTRDGRVGCVGDRGQRGDVPPTGGSTPVFLPLSNVVDITAGANHACALLKSGEAYCWGGNVRGQLGDGVSTEYQVAPVKVAGLEGAVSLSAGNAHTCARSVAGNVLCWGMNQYGQLGDGTFEDRVAPTPVAGLSDVVQISTGEYHTCVRSGVGQVACFGRNEHRQLGAGEQAMSAMPQALAARAVTEISAGERHTCLCDREGHLSCFGDNESGQLGIGQQQQSAARPTKVEIPGGACRTLSAGAAHTCVLSRAGAMYCFGLNDGQLGDGSTAVRFSPVAVADFSPASP